MIKPISTSLKSHNTFGFDILAEQFFTIDSKAVLLEWIQNFKDKTPRIIGGGSNILWNVEVEKRPVLWNQIKGIEIENETDDHIVLRVGGGVVWHDFTRYCVENGYYGVENLSLIPGNVGAAPIQNIGAYGVEIKSVISNVEAIELSSGKTRFFDQKQCRFGYRDSIFKNELKDKVFITNVAFKLSKNPSFNLSYGDLKILKNPTLQAVSQKVIEIRTSKLPDPKQIGNAGSFFKNPIVENDLVERLKTEFENIVHYPVDNKTSKLAAGWLIEQAGWKGFENNNIGVHHKQALVLIHKGGGKARDVYELSEKIIQSVNEKFGVTLQREVNIWT